MSIDQIKDAIESGGTGEDLAGLTIPDTYRAAHTLRSEQEMFADMASADKDPRKSLHVGQVPTPELAPDEVVVAVMASAINYNTVGKAHGQESVVARQFKLRTCHLDHLAVLPFHANRLQSR